MEFTANTENGMETSSLTCFVVVVVAFVCCILCSRSIEAFIHFQGAFMPLELPLHSLHELCPLPELPNTRIDDAVAV